MDWKTRLRNKYFWVSLASAVVLLTQQLGLNIFPNNIGEIVNTVLVIFTILGVIIDPSSDGLLDSKGGMNNVTDTKENKSV
ncbi:phage holin [Romboutsia timonensis]|uniref:phage holin n=1 Tax=Romboutsia timonensis TaxID=1776391 RepID=UPI002A832DB5|nr:phage holin [Romboutsia timonensis]MDY3959647.1 phage holin [Romboutsia timonensis]